MYPHAMLHSLNSINIAPNKLVKANQVVFHEGDKPDGVYYVCSGRLQVTRLMSGQPAILAELGDDDIFGELAMVDDRNRAATVTALEDSWLYHFTSESFTQRLSEMDELLHNMFVTLALTIRNQNLKIEQLHAALRNNGISLDADEEDVKYTR